MNRIKAWLFEWFEGFIKTDPYEATLLNGVTQQGAGTAVTIDKYSKFKAQVAGLTTGTVKVEGSVDGANFADISNGGKVDTNGLLTIDGGVYKKVRGNITAYTSGTITVTFIAKH